MKLKRILSGLLIFVMVFCLIPISQLEVKALTSADSLYEYTLSGNQATITTYNGSAEELYIPEQIDGYTVVAIGDSVFSGKGLLKVVVPDTVTSIGNYAFENCTSLKEVTLSKSLTNLGCGAFLGTIISEVEIPKSLTDCGYNGWYGYTFNNKEYLLYYGPFGKCENLKTVTFENGTTEIANHLFWGCVGIEKIVIPDTVTVIENNAFRDCLRLNEVVIGNSVTTIEGYAFENCVSLKEVTLSKSLTYLGCGAFSGTIISEIEIPKSLTDCGYNGWYGYTFNNKEYLLYYGPFGKCENLKTVTFENGTTEIANHLFWGCVGIEKIVIPDTVTVIENNAFRDCLRLNEVVIGNSVTTIEGYAFGNCVSLESVDIPDSVTTIEGYAFGNCVSLESVDIPDSVTTIEGYAFENCISLKEVSLSKSLTYLGCGAFSGTIISEIEIPKSLTDCGYNWSYSYTFNSKSYSLDYGPFGKCENLKTVTFENGATEIANNLFRGCVGIEKIVIPDTVTVIEYAAFDDCLRLNEVVIGNSVTTINDSAFNNCVSLESVDIPDSVTSIGNCAFENCTSLKAISFPSTITTICSYAFSGCKSLESVVFEGNSNLDLIQSGVFSGCSSLKAMILPEKTREIGSYAFENCTALENVYIPRSTKTIGEYAFKGCEELETVNIADYSITEIKTQTFMDCPGIKEITLPNGLKTIGSQAFANCTGLTKIVIPESVTSIDSTALSYPNKTVIYGRKDSYAETFANANGFMFYDNLILIEGIIIKDGIEDITLKAGEKYIAEFELYPEDANEFITLTANNSNVTINGHDIYAQKAGDTVITATTAGGMEYTFNIHIRSASSISIKSLPTKTEYGIGEEFDKTGLVVEVEYNDGYTENVEDYTISGFSSTAEGTKTVTVKWTALNGSSYSTNFTVDIVDRAPQLTGIYVDKLPNKVDYVLREKLDTTGMVVMGTYDNGSTQEITDYTVSGYNALKKGTQTIKVKYGDFNTTFTVTVGDAHTHTYDNDCDTTCNGCSYTRTTEHAWGEYIYNDDATTTADGTETRTCSSCGETETRTAEGTKLPADPTYRPDSHMPFVTLNDAGNGVVLDHNKSWATRVYWGCIGDEFVEYKWFDEDFRLLCGTDYFADYSPKAGETYNFTKPGWYRFVVKGIRTGTTVEDYTYSELVYDFYYDGTNAPTVPTITELGNNQVRIDTNGTSIKKFYYGNIGQTNTPYSWFNSFWGTALGTKTYTPVFDNRDGRIITLQTKGYYNIIIVDTNNNEYVYTVYADDNAPVIKKADNTAVVDIDILKGNVGTKATITKLYYGYLGTEDKDISTWDEFTANITKRVAASNVSQGTTYNLANKGYYKFYTVMTLSNGKTIEAVYTVDNN